MTDFNAIIDRLEKSKRLTDKRLDDIALVVQKVEAMMIELKIEKLGDYYLRTTKASAGNSTDLAIDITVKDDYYEHEVASVRLAAMPDSKRKVQYMYGDYHATYNSPNRGDLIKFIGDLPNLFEEMDKIMTENEKVFKKLSKVEV